MKCIGMLFYVKGLPDKINSSMNFALDIILIHDERVEQIKMGLQLFRRSKIAQFFKQSTYQISVDFKII